MLAENERKHGRAERRKEKQRLLIWTVLEMWGYEKRGSWKKKLRTKGMD
jgi:hypothetical protein